MSLYQNTTAMTSQESLPDNVEAHIDSTFGSEVDSDTTSVTSAIFKGYISNGRRYQSLVDKAYYQPADEKQLASYEAGHLLFLIVDSQRKNPLFRAPVPKSGGCVLDVGTGGAQWALDTADKFPQLTVYGVDLSPPPETWVPPNCILEVDDLTRNWTWNHKWDLVHLRYMTGAFDEREWMKVYAEAYKNLQPGGWIEHVEGDIGFFCDDESLPADSVLISHRKRFLKAAARSGRPLDATEKMRSRIEAAGFTNIQQQDYKMPLGTWPKHPVYRDAGRVNIQMLKNGLEGYTLFLLTKFGDERPWSVDESQVLLAKMIADIDNPNYHIYQKATRIWAQKPLNP